MPSLTFPDEVDATATTSAREVLESAPADRPTLALVSGGHDSLTAMHIAHQSPLVDLDGIVHINTAIGVPETRAFVQQRASALGIPYIEVGKPFDHIAGHEYRYINEEYTELVAEFGFPGPGAHKWMYVNLKEKPLQRFLRDQYPDERPVLVSGVSRHESDRRKVNVDDTGTQEFLGCPTVSPIVEFTGLDVRRYRRGLGLEMNPVVEQLEMSGECLCGAYADRGELKMLKLFYPNAYRHILCIEARVRAAAGLEGGPPPKYKRWGHNRLQDRERDALDDNDQMLLCESCEMQTECDSDGGGDC